MPGLQIGGLDVQRSGPSKTRADSPLLQSAGNSGWGADRLGDHTTERHALMQALKVWNETPPGCNSLPLMNLDVIDQRSAIRAAR